jgi:hypothetical protein
VGGIIFAVALSPEARLYELNLVVLAGIGIIANQQLRQRII